MNIERMTPNEHLHMQRAEVRRIIREHKKACVNCGEDDYRCLDFDHRDPKAKLFNISHAPRICASRPGFERLRAEIAKCDIRCANCHRKRSYAEGHITMGWDKVNGR